ncbi:hypothetical protein [Spirochaeta cellobiosiphila]|uniref:hypothetical protein n=1 Tax=Spirochaeta cellobiosiphila TaxID=504483 RepID=UPI000409083E|nr:hypothetical protein [Spirochaeta cellobiosiphila]
MCKYYDICLFIHCKLQGKPELAEEVTKAFCLTDPLGCARYKVADSLGKESVSANLYPSETARAEAEIAAKR